MNVEFPAIDEIYLAASEQHDVDERAAYLDEACGRETELRRRVEALLAAEAKVSQFLESPAIAPVTALDFVDRGEDPGTVIGPYKVLELIGEGGMGVVYLAEQAKPVRRQVALKVIKPGMDTKQVIARFEAERQALALMDHPNIAKVHDAGATESGRPYFAMELVRGIPITEFCDREQRSIRDRLELFVLVCRAVQHAHQKGIIHRDLKPTNILVTLVDGSAVPKVIDFGVAKATGGSLTDRTLFTGFHQLVGTPLYMSPEQAELSRVDVDTRSDIYSLGVLLYELLAGVTPFDAARLRVVPFDEVWRILRELEPPRPSSRLKGAAVTAIAISGNRRTEPGKLSQVLRGELDWIVMKCLEKDRSRRYETANALAKDLVRYLSDQPVEACPTSLKYRFWKYARRNRAVLAVASVVSLLLIAGTTISTWQALRATAAEKRMAAALVGSEEHRHRAERHLYAFRLRQVQQTFEQGEVERAQERLGLLRDELGEPETSDFAGRYLHHLLSHESELFVRHSAAVTNMTHSYDRRLLASGDIHGTIVLTDLASGWTRHRFIAHTTLHDLAFSPDGQRLASVSGHIGPPERSEVGIWDVGSGRRLAQIDSFRSTKFWDMTFSSSGRRLLIAFQEGPDDPITVQLFDLESKPAQPVLIRSLQVQPVYGIAVDHTSLAAQPLDRYFTIFDAETLQARWSVPDRDRGQSLPSLSTDGRRLATADDRCAVIWDTVTGHELNRVWFGEAKRKFNSLVLSADLSKSLVGRDRRWIVFDLVGGRANSQCELAFEKPEQLDMLMPIFSPDGSKLAVMSNRMASQPQPVAIWDSGTGRHLATYPGGPATFDQILFAPDGESLFVSRSSGVQRWWFQRPRIENHQRLAGHRDEAWSLAFSPDGRILASGSDDTEPDDTIKLWDAATGRLLNGWRPSTPGTIAALAFSPDGHTLASAALAPSENLRLWDVATGRLLATLDGGSDAVRSVAFSPDGTRLASAGSDRTIRLWDAHTGKPLATYSGHTDNVRKVAFSPDGRMLASASNDRTARLWDVATGKMTSEFQTLKKASAVTFAADGSLLAAADEGGDITLWDPSTGEQRGSIHADLEQLFTMAFSPDGRNLAAAGSSRVVRIWDVLTGQELLALSGHAAQINSVAFSPDGRTLASCSHDGAVKMWRTQVQGLPPGN